MASYDYSDDLIDLSNPLLVTTKIIGATPKNARVLELGCHNGYMSRYLKGRGCSVVGIDLRQDALESARRFCDQVFALDLDSFDKKIFAEPFFDCIVAADVLEHLKNPPDLLIKLRDILRPEGKIIASIPNITHVSLALMMLQGRFDYRPSGLLDDTHLRFFSENGIYHLFESSGYFIQRLDRVYAGFGSTEFDRFLPAVKEEILKFAAKNKNASVYQFIIEARPCSEASTVQRLREEAQKAKVYHPEALEQSIRYWRQAYAALDKKYAVLSTTLYRIHGPLFGKLVKSWVRLRTMKRVPPLSFFRWLQPLMRITYALLSKYLLPKRHLKRFLLKFSPDQFPGFLRRYHPLERATQLPRMYLKLDCIGAEDHPRTREICRALERRGNRLENERVDGIVVLGSSSLFKTPSPLGAPEGSSRHHLVGNNIPCVFCLCNPDANAFKTLTARLPCAVLAFTDNNSLRPPFPDGLDVRWFNLSTGFSDVQRGAFLACNIEELFIEMLTPIDPALTLSGSYGKDFVRVAPRMNFPLPPAESLTFIIPTHNAGSEFKKTLESIREQRIYGESGILVVDSGSKDETVPLSQQYGARIVSIEKSTFNHGLTRDHAISNTTTPFVCLLVQDAALVDTETIPTMMRHFSLPQVAGVYTCSLPMAAHDIFGRGEVEIHRSYLGPYAKHFTLPTPEDLECLDTRARRQFFRFDNVCSVLRRQVWEHNPFGEVSFGEDISWSKTAQVAGFTIAYEPFARVFHSHLRPAEYTRQRTLIDCAVGSEIIGGDEGLATHLSDTEIDRCRQVIREDIQSFTRALASSSHEDLVPNVRVRQSLTGLFQRILKDEGRISFDLEKYRLRLLPLLALLIHGRKPTESISLQEAKQLVEKVHASIEGGLLGDYIVALKHQKKSVPHIIEKMLKEARLSV